LVEPPPAAGRVPAALDEDSEVADGGSGAKGFVDRADAAAADVGAAAVDEALPAPDDALDVAAGLGLRAACCWLSHSTKSMAADPRRGAGEEERPRVVVSMKLRRRRVAWV